MGVDARESRAASYVCVCEADACQSVHRPHTCCTSHREWLARYTLDTHRDQERTAGDSLKY